MSVPSPSIERWRRLEEVFESVIDLDVGARMVALDAACAGDDGLRRELEAMLAQTDTDEKVRAIVGREADGLATSLAAPIQEKLGPYSLRRMIGRGGMGTVFLAKRDDYRADVAIKLLQRGLASKEAVARFRDERQILATLEHPNIVRLLDGGTSDEGLPYLVMEYVEGEPITRFAERLPIRERVKLLRKVCEAVQHAHARLVVHRDLKPSNILVTAAGEPKLLDFGIARLLDDTEREAQTRTGMYLLTPEYASPEQVRGEPASTTSDVYALGAILYELLSGKPAHQGVGGGGLDALLAIVEVPPERPSAVAPIEHRRAIAGDLDNIALKALAKEPRHRYASVEQLSADLRRHLDGMPVEARAATWLYRTGKFLGRNRVAVALATLVILALSTAAAISIDQARRARAAARRADERFKDVRRLANTLLFDVDDKIATITGSTAAREMIVTRALEYLDRLAREASSDPGLARELAAAYIKVGDIQGNQDSPNLGHERDALASWDKARDILAHLDDDQEVLRLRAQAVSNPGWLLFQMGDARGLPTLREAAAMIGKLSPSSESYFLAVKIHTRLCQVHSYAGNPSAAEVEQQAASDAASAWLRIERSPRTRYWLGVTTGLASHPRWDLGDPDGALEAREAARKIFAELSAEFPDDASYRRELAFNLLNIGALRGGAGEAQEWGPHLDDGHGAQLALAESMRLFEQIQAKDPADSRAAITTADAVTRLAMVDRDPLPPYARALSILQALPAVARESHAAKDSERLVQCAMAAPLARAGRRVEARRAIERGSILASQSPQVVDKAECEFQVAPARLALGEANVDKRLEEVAAELRRLSTTTPASFQYRIGLVETLRRLSQLRPQDRCKLLEEARAVWSASQAAPTPFTKRWQASLDADVSRCATGQ
jgi:hypothetical protein